MFYSLSVLLMFSLLLLHYVGNEILKNKQKSEHRIFP